MADAIGANVMEYELFDQDNLPKYDLIGFGSGIYYNKPGANLITFINELKNCEK